MTAEPDYTIMTNDLGTWVLATYICPSCEREFYDDAGVSNPEYCAYCGESL